MQLVLSNNRVIAHGENFISMGGGVVINTETGAKYENATVTECSGCPSDIGAVGYEYRAGVFVPCAPYGKSNKGNILVACEECGTPRDSGVSIDEVCAVSSYLAFVGNVNEDMVAAAFGKNNENLIKNIGKQLAMYGWYKGDDKAEHPFKQLQKMLTINDINNDIYDEIISSDNISDLILANEYAKSKFVETNSLYSHLYSGEQAPEDKIENIIVTEEDLLHPFRLSYKFSASGGKSSSALYINDVEVGGFSRPAEGSYKGETGIFKNWSDCGITTPGTYSAKIHIDRINTDAVLDVSFFIYKMKQSYDV